MADKKELSIKETIGCLLVFTIICNHSIFRLDTHVP